MTNWAAGMDITAARLIDATKADQLTFTPSFGNLGTGTYTTQTGYYFTIGKLVWFSAFIVINAAGSGSTDLTFHGPPPSVDRTLRQAITVNATGEGGGNAVRTGFTLAVPTGSGGTWDQVYTTQNTVTDMIRLSGSGVSAGSSWMISGMYLST